MERGPRARNAPIIIPIIFCPGCRVLAVNAAPHSLVGVALRAEPERDSPGPRTASSAVCEGVGSGGWLVWKAGGGLYGEAPHRGDDPCHNPICARGGGSVGEGGRETQEGLTQFWRRLRSGTEPGASCTGRRGKGEVPINKSPTSYTDRPHLWCSEVAVRCAMLIGWWWSWRHNARLTSHAGTRPTPAWLGPPWRGSARVIDGGHVKWYQARQDTRQRLRCSHPPSTSLHYPRGYICCRPPLHC